MPLSPPQLYFPEIEEPGAGDAALVDELNRQTVQRDIARMDAECAFEVQLRRDIGRQPIEDVFVEWKEEEAPFVQVATLHWPQQDGLEKTEARSVDESMRFSLWTGLGAYRPLGGINRPGRDTYRHLAEFRAAVNGCPFHEPAA